MLLVGKAGDPDAAAQVTEDPEDLVITTATQTPEQLRENLGLKPPEPTKEETEAAEKADAEARAAIVDPDLDKHIDQIEPPKKDETEAERKERRSRSSKRIVQLNSRTKQAEEETARLRKENEDLKAKLAPPPAGDKKPDATAAAAAAKEFKFDTFDEYQEKHPEADWEAWSDARQDARWAWKQANEKPAAAAKADEGQAELTPEEKAEFEELKALSAAVVPHVETFKAAHPDYDTVTDAVKIPRNADNTGPSPAAVTLQKLILREGEQVPALLYYLGSHPAEAKKLFDAENFAAQLMAYGVFKTNVEAWVKEGAPASAAAKAAPPKKPVTKAPDPASDVRAGANNDRTLAQIADDDEDADAYIAERQRQQGVA